MKISFEKKSAGKADAVVVFAAEGGKLAGAALKLDEKSRGALKRAIKAEGFTGGKGKFLTVAGPEGVAAAHIVVAGLGKPAELKARDFEAIGSGLTAALNARKAASAQVLFDDENCDAPKDIAAAHLAEGMLLNSYRFDKYLTREPKEKKPTLKSVEVVLSEAAAARKDFERKRKVAEAVFWARDLVSEVANVLYPESYADIIKRELAPLGVEVKILGRREMQKLGMNALVSVGLGSVKEEKLVTMQWRGGPKNQKNVAFVGKGVTFDSGGISL
ncbi:MAG: leucyl aminopeptidase, partial [Alphaproteobacteria bacterium]|nr:leucyl aminopeptidase [Alphaproteobacteria bacterium]